MSIVKGMEENPGDPKYQEALKDPTVMGKLNKLVAAGVIRLGGM